MKLFIMMILLVSGVAQADSTALETFLYDGSSNSQSVKLSTEKTKTEYRQVPVQTICYRTELRYRCRPGAPICRQICDSRGQCRTSCSPGRRICRNEPVTVSYPCTRIETRPFQVHDYFVETNVNVEFSNNDSALPVAESFTVKVTGEKPSLTVKGSKNYFLLLDNVVKAENRQGDIKYIDLTYKVRLVAADTAQSVLRNGIRNVKLRRGVLTFKLGNGFNLKDFTQNIRIFKNYRFGRDVLVLDRALSEAEVEIVQTNSTSNIRIDLNTLGIDLPSKLRIILDTKFNIAKDKLLNKNELKTETSANWVFR